MNMIMHMLRISFFSNKKKENIVDKILLLFGTNKNN